MNLTPGETRVYDLLFTDMSRAEMALHSGLSWVTIADYLVQIYEKLDIHSRAEICAYSDEEARTVALRMSRIYCLSGRQESVLAGLLGGDTYGRIGLDMSIKKKSAQAIATGLFKALGVSGRIGVLALMLGPGAHS